MNKELVVGKSYDYVTAISGVFITPSNPSGLTVREREVVAALLEIIDKASINPRIEKKLWQEFKEAVNLKTQSMSNMMRVLKQKKAVSFHNGVYRLHPILRKNEGLTIKYDT